MQPIFNLMSTTSADYSHYKYGRNILVSHTKYLRESKSSLVHMVEPERAQRFNYCLNAYLRSIAVDVKIHWLVQVINNLNSPEDFNIGIKKLIIPSLQEVADILAVADL